ncbi:MAG: hypothetical protein QM500_15525 [Methylococcales bacterium]
MSIVKQSAALTTLLDVCTDYDLKSSTKGHTLTVRFGNYVYKAEKKFLYDFAQELGTFLSKMPKVVKDKYLVLK